jgi:hypothetical protein
MIRDQGSKNHHYLPQFYINKFRNEQNKVWVFDFESFNQYSNKSNNFSYLKFIREKSSKSFAYIENDNTLFNLKRVGINDYPEQELAKYEKEVSILPIPSIAAKRTNHLFSNCVSTKAPKPVRY